MTYGASFLGSSGVTQVDENYSNFHLTQKFQIAIGSGGYGVSAWFSGFKPALFTSNPASSHCTSELEFNSTYGWRVVIRGFSGVSVTSYVFDFTNPTTTSSFGLSVFKQNGELAFSSDWKVLRIGAVAKIPDNAPWTGPTFSTPYSASWASCISWPQLFIDDGGGSEISNFQIQGARTTSTFCELGFVAGPNIHTGGNGEILQRYGGQLILADVTGY